MSLITGTAKCTLCNKVFYGPASMQLIGSGTGQDRLVKFCTEIYEHVTQAHKEHNSYLEHQALEFLGLLRMLCYTVSDSELQDQRNYLRWATHQATLNARFTDEQLVGIAAAVTQRIERASFSHVDILLCQGQILQALTEMRAELQESGRYKFPAAPENQPKVGSLTSF